MTRELLDDVLARPDDDVPRRIYSDWLTDRGDPRGELIAVQLELAHLPRKHASRKSLEVRERELMFAHGKTWISDLGLTSDVTAQFGTSPAELVRGATVVFRRGFPDEAKLAPSGIGGLARTPLRRLVLCDLTDSLVEHIEQLPTLPALVTLRLRDVTFGADPMRRVCDSAIASTVTQLECHRLRLMSSAGFATGTLPAMTSLILDNCQLESCRALTAARWLPQLRWLRVKEAHDFSHLGAWLRCDDWRDLTRLSLDAPLDDGDVAAIATSSIAQELEFLESAPARASRRSRDRPQLPRRARKPHALPTTTADPLPTARLLNCRVLERERRERCHSVRRRRWRR